MKLKYLKKVRIILSLTFFLVITLFFLGPTVPVLARPAGYVLYFQFIPSFFTFLSVGMLAGAGFLVVLGLTVLFGRGYCSSVCPLGILQDISTYARKKMIKTRYAFGTPWSKLRYIVLLSVFVPAFGGIFIGLNLLDPFSNFGRMITHIFKPLAIGINNTVSSLFAGFGIYTVQPLEYTGMHPFALVFSLSVLGLVTILSMKAGRLFCNTLCPVGTLLGFLSRFALFKIKVDRFACTKCRACEKVCKTGCINVREAEVDFSRCVCCFNCLAVCPESAVTYRRSFGKNAVQPEFSPKKRDFIRQTGGLLLTGIAAPVGFPVEIYKESTIPVIREFPVSPPGSGSIAHFTDRCTACHLCVSACPTRVLQPSFLEYGWMGIMQPRMDYKASFCNYDCVVCSSVCPSGAILPLNMEKKQQTQLGKVRFIEKNCVVYAQKTDCGACAEHCPTKAVRMELDPAINKKVPKTDEILCVGCGACEFACPTRPYKAIYVESSPVHGVAKKPVEEKITDPVDLKEDFPF